MSSHRNEYDAMKTLLNITRSYKNNINEGSIPQLQPQEIEDEKTRFVQAVTPTVEFGNFVPYNNNIEWSGLLVKEKIKWTFSLDQTVGCFISCDNTQLSDDTVRVLQNLKAFYDEWSKYWGEQISSR